MNLNPPAKHYDPLYIRPKLPGKNFDCHVRIRIKKPELTTEDQYRRVILSFADLDYWEHTDRQGLGGRDLLGILVTDDNRAYAYSGKPVDAGPPIERRASMIERELQLRIVRVEGQGEVSIDGRRLLYIPVCDDVDNLAIYLISNGLPADVLDFRIEELIERL